jgi:two-component system OmpR family sensor kinase
VVTTLNKEERIALFKFLSIYMFSAAILISIIAILYYKKEMISIQEHSTMEMQNKALMIEKELINAHMEGREYHYNTSLEKRFQIGLFNEEKQTVYSSLRSKEVFFEKRVYKNDSYEYIVDTLQMPIFGVKYIVIEGTEGFEQKLKLTILIFGVVVVSTVFVGFIGYFLSQLLLNPIKQRVQKLDDFIKDSSHELNTPISALMMSVSSLKNKKEVDSRVLNHIAVSVKQIAQIYNSLSFLAFFDRDEVVNEEFDLQEVIKESVKFFEEIAQVKGNRFELHLEPTLVFMDKSRIQKVFNNLFSNAIKYSYPNTPIKLELKNRIFSIEDEGVGIKKEDQKSIFNRFERKSKEQGGFGIGLDIVKSICKMYDIKFWVHSQLQKGSTFYLQFS